MSMKHRILTTAIAALLVIGTASPAIAKAPEASLKTKKVATVIAGDTAWVVVNWQGRGGDISDFKVVAEAPAGIEVTYPENTPGFTGLMNGHVLSEKEIDFTALNVSVPYSQISDFKIKLLVSYTADGAPVEETFDIKVPVAEYQADQDVAQATRALDPITAGEAVWRTVDYAGLAPMVEDFRLEVSDPAGMAVAYPMAKSSSSLYFNSVLEDSETDFAAIWVDTIGVAPGTYTLGLTVSYTMAGSPKTATGTVTVDVTG